jgi:septal ring factor EnvC (AmiA/AmiB activator)
VPHPLLRNNGRDPTTSALAAEEQVRRERTAAETKARAQVDADAHQKERDACLDRTKAAEDEDALAVKEREATNQRIHDTLARAAAERKAADAAADAKDGDNDKASHVYVTTPDPNNFTPMLLLSTTSGFSSRSSSTSPPTTTPVGASSSFSPSASSPCRTMSNVTAPP